MFEEEIIRVLLFLLSLVAIYLCAAGVLIALLLQKINVIKPISSKLWEWFGRSILTLAVIGVLCISYGFFIEPYWPSITHIHLKSRKIMKDHQPIRLVQISDFHSDPKQRLEGRLPQLIRALNPHLIFFTGDCINSPSGLPVFKSSMKRISAISPVYAVKGNWDVHWWDKLDLFGGTGAHELQGESVKLEIENNPITIAGVAANEEGKIDDLVQKNTNESFNIVLYHYPIVLSPTSQKKVDLVLTGHVHGGNVALPFYGALITLSRYGKTYEAGLYRTGDTWLYVNRGIGMEGGHAPRVRFWSRPEITIFEIGPED